MADRIHVSSDILAHGFNHVPYAIHAWGDVEGDTFEDLHAGIIVTQKNGDLFVISHSEIDKPKLLFRSFDLRKIEDLIAVLGVGN